MHIPYWSIEPVTFVSREHLLIKSIRLLRTEYKGLTRIEEMTLGLINANPVVQAKKERLVRTEDQYRDDGLDPLEIYDILVLNWVWFRSICFGFLLFLDVFSFMYNFGSLTKMDKVCKRYKRSRTSLFLGAAKCSVWRIYYNRWKVRSCPVS